MKERHDKHDARYIEDIFYCGLQQVKCLYACPMKMLGAS